MRQQPGLVVDKDLGDTPGLHAFVIGISQYPYLPSQNEPPRRAQFGLRSVDGPALSAWRLARMLKSPPANASWVQPLRTLRVLLLPSAADAEDPVAKAAKFDDWVGPVPDLATVRQVATAWQADCERSDREAALFYFAGHGLRLDADCLVLAGFGKDADEANPSLSGCCPLDKFMQGMFARPGQAMAREQFWFVDACRTQINPELLGQVILPERLLSIRLGDGQDLRQFGVQATGQGIAALSLPGQAGTAFGSALLNGLTGAVGKSVPWPLGVPEARAAWPVNIPDLLEAIKSQLGANPVTKGQRPGLLGAGGNGPLILHMEPPSIPIRLDVSPSRMPASVTEVKLERRNGNPAYLKNLRALKPCPYSDTVPAGYYDVQWTSAGKRCNDTWFASLASGDLLL